MKKSMAFALGLAAVTACSTKRQASEAPSLSPITKTKTTAIGAASHVPAAIVYRTTKDYDSHVPVTMDETRTRITSYPAPTDIRTADGYATPTPLCGGYLLDRRGITPNTAFLDYTYAEYAALEATPSAEELVKHVIDKHPIAELYVLPLTVHEAWADTTRCNAIISGGFVGCKAMTK